MYDEHEHMCFILVKIFLCLQLKQCFHNGLFTQSWMQLSKIFYTHHKETKVT